MFATAPLPRGVLRALPASWCAPLSLGAAAIHFAVIPDHLREWWAFGLFFAALGWFQAIWPIAYLDRPSRPLAWLAVAINGATVVLWAWSRTAGLPIGPEPGMAEAVGAPDVVATVFELALALGLLITPAAEPTTRAAEPTSDARPSSRPGAGWGVLTIATWIGIAALTTAAIGLAGA